MDEEGSTGGSFQHESRLEELKPNLDSLSALSPGIHSLIQAHMRDLP